MSAYREPRAKCGQCGRSFPERLTVRVPGRRAGDYRRASASAYRRVCRSCTVERVAYVRAMVWRDRPIGLSDSHVSWADAAERFGLNVDDLPRSTWVLHDWRAREAARLELLRWDALAEHCTPQESSP